MKAFNIKEEKRNRNLQTILGTSLIFVSGLSIYAYQNINKLTVYVGFAAGAAIIGGINCYHAIEADAKIKKYK